MSVDSMRMKAPLPEAIAESRQLILSTTSGWDAVDGEMRLYERDSINDQWKAVGEKIPIVVGRDGMAWGRGVDGGARWERKRFRLSWDATEWLGAGACMATPLAKGR